MSDARKAWRVEGLDYFTRTWDHVLDCHAASNTDALVTGWYYLFMFVIFNKRLYIASLRARPLNEEHSNVDDRQEEGALEFRDISEVPEPW